MIHKYIFGLFLVLFVGQIVTAQKLDERKLNLYKPGKTKVLSFYVGNEMTFKMKDFDRFYTFRITDLKNDTILFDSHVVRLHQIEAVKYPRAGSDFMRSTSFSLIIFGGSWLFYTGIDDVMGNDPSWARAGIIAGIATGIGATLQLFTRPKTYRLDEDRYLRILTP